MRALHSIAESSNQLACSLLMVPIPSSPFHGMGQGAVEMPPPSGGPTQRRRYSLSHQASIERTQIQASPPLPPSLPIDSSQGLKRQNTLNRRRQLEKCAENKEISRELNDEGIDVIFSIASGCASFSIVICSSAAIPHFLPYALATLYDNHIDMLHLETRGTEAAEGFDLLVECRGHKEEALAALALLNSSPSITSVRVYATQKEAEVPWFPRHISDLDKCSNCITKYEPTTDPRHPGFGDEEYIARREELNQLAKGFKHGDVIVDVEYSEKEHDTWREVVLKLESLHSQLACSTYRRNLKMLLDEGIITKDRIPQLRLINSFLEKRTGFVLRPCSGLLSARDFLASLAFRVFQTTQYVRHWRKPHHSPEPDLIHELLGHVPMFADPGLAQMSQDIGLMSLGATDEQIEKLATVYWFIVEFGLCREEGKLKAIGAGLLSAFGELQHACSDVPEHREFVPSETAMQKYEDDDYQPLYFVAEGIEEALAKLREYATSFARPFSLLYDPFTRSVTKISSVSDLSGALHRFKLDLSAINTSIRYLPKGEEREETKESSK